MKKQWARIFLLAFLMKADLIFVPVRILWGGKDTWLDPSQAEALAARIPGSEVRIVSGAGHFVMEDEPRTVAEILANFFDG